MTTWKVETMFRFPNVLDRTGLRPIALLKAQGYHLRPSPDFIHEMEIIEIYSSYLVINRIIYLPSFCIFVAEANTSQSEKRM